MIRVKRSNIPLQSVGYSEGRYPLAGQHGASYAAFQSMRISLQRKRQPEIKVQVFVNGKVWHTFNSWQRAMNWAYRFRRKPNARMVIDSIWAQSGDEIRVIKGAGPCRDIMLTHTGVA